MKRLIPTNPIFQFFSTLFRFVIAYPVLSIINFGILGLRIRGRKHLRALKKSGYVAVCNHVHPMDCTFLGLLLFPRNLIFTSLERLFSIPFLGALIRFLGSVPVPASAARMKRFLEQMASAVQGGRTACIYPEGELLLRCDHLREFHDGAFYIAAAAHAPVVPVFISWNRRGGLWRLKKNPCYTITAGPPIYPNTALSAREASKELKEKTLTWMRSQAGATPAYEMPVEEELEIRPTF